MVYASWSIQTRHSSKLNLIVTHTKKMETFSLIICSVGLMTSWLQKTIFHRHCLLWIIFNWTLVCPWNSLVQLNDRHLFFPKGAVFFLQDQPCSTGPSAGQISTSVLVHWACTVTQCLVANQSTESSISVLKHDL